MDGWAVQMKSQFRNFIFRQFFVNINLIFQNVLIAHMLDFQITSHMLLNWKLAARVNGEFTQAKTYEVVLELLENGTEMDVIIISFDATRAYG